VALAGVLAATAVVVPDSAPPTNDYYLVSVDRAHGVDLSPDVTWIMAIGSDARVGQDPLHSRGDALQLIGIDSKTGAAAAIGIPRDSWVDIPGYGMEKINAALYFGGPQGMAGAVQNLVGIQPDYVMVTTFKGLIAMVQDIHGITVHNPVAFSDSHLAPRGFERGKIHLNGYRAMAFSRARHDLIAGDFDRSANQQRTVRGIYDRIRQRAHQPGFIEMGVQSVLKHMSSDVDPIELYRIAQAIVQVDPRKITNCVVQGSTGYVGAASVVFPDRAMAARFGDDARNDATLKSC
jgi:polyisoprenyl-teichoic acid--peptidoglycan teichoic acid transferase